MKWTKGKGSRVGLAWIWLGRVELGKAFLNAVEVAFVLQREWGEVRANKTFDTMRMYVHLYMKM